MLTEAIQKKGIERERGKERAYLPQADGKIIHRFRNTHDEPFV